MSTFKEKSCLQVTAPAFLRDNKSKTIELLKLRQCRDSCCPRIFTDKRAEELVSRGFATTTDSKASISKEASVGAFPVRTEISGIAATEFTVTLETDRGPIVNTSAPGKDKVSFEYEVNGGATVAAAAALQLKEDAGLPIKLKDTQTEGGLASTNVITWATKLSLTPASGGTAVITTLETGTFTLP